MRAATRHALTGLLLAAASLGVVANIDSLHPLVSAEPRNDPVVARPASGAAGDDLPRLDRRTRTDRSATRTRIDRLWSTGPATPSAPSSEAVSQRDKELRAQRDKRRQTAEDLLRTMIEEQGYDPRTADTPREIGKQIAANKFGWTGAQWTCYDKLIMSESKWDPYATNPYSGAYGIPQSLPASKMASEGADWRTNPATQIRWGLKYVRRSYGTPCSAWAFKRSHNWY